MSILEQLLSHTTIIATGCWLYDHRVMPNGYAQIDKHDYAHRVSYELFRGPIPPGKELDHTCHSLDLSCQERNACIHRRCINPWHLEPVTHRVNLLRGRTFIAQEAAQNTCKNGHLFDAVWQDGNGKVKRRCKTCKNTQVRASYYRRKLRKVA
jgi:hypothetical protein